MPLAAELFAMADDIHAHPELGFEELHTSTLLCDALERAGFEVARGAGGLDTAFVATFGDPAGPTAV